jgi:hypothetical protein
MNRIKSMNSTLRTLSVGWFFCGILWGGTWPGIRGCADSVPGVLAQNQRLGRGAEGTRREQSTGSDETDPGQSV